MEPRRRDEFDRILRFWFDRGVAGFRIDVAHGLIKDRELRDGVRYMRERPEVHEIFARWQEIAREYDPKPTLMGETYVALERALRATTRTSTSPRTSRSCTPSSRSTSCARSSRRLSAAPEGRAALVRLEPRPLAARDPLGGRRRAEGARGALPAADPARDRRPLPGRRDRARRRRRAGEARARPGASRRATRSARRCRGRAAGDEWRDPWLPLSDTSAQRRGPARRSCEHARTTSRPDRAAQASSPTRLPHAAQRKGRLGLRSRRSTCVAQHDPRHGR